MSFCKRIQAVPERWLPVSLRFRKVQGNRTACGLDDACIAAQTTPLGKTAPPRLLAPLAGTGAPDLLPLKFSNKAYVGDARKGADD